MAVTTKMSVDVSGFKKGMAEAQASVRTMDAALKKNEAQYKATGNAEDYMSKKTDLLKQKLDSQKQAAANAEQALIALGKSGVDPASQEYQKMAQTLLNAQAAVLETQSALNGLDGTQQKAVTSADRLANSVNSIGKKISLDQVIGGINRITSGLENAAKKAVRLGQEIWDNIMDSASWADDVSTMAARTGLTVEEIQKMKAVAAEFEAPVETMAKSWKKLKMNMTSDTDEVVQAFAKLGVATAEYQAGKYGDVVTGLRDYRDVFWEVGEAIMQVADEAEQERLAQTLLGRSWDELIPLFTKGRAAYEEAMDNASAASEEAIENNAALADSVAELQHDFEVFKQEILGSISPEITKVTETFSGLLKAITEYIQTPEGQELIGKIGTAIEGLVDDIAKIDPEAVVSGFVSVMESLIKGLDLIVQNKDRLVNALKAIALAFAGLKVAEGVLEFLRLITNFKSLFTKGTPTVDNPTVVPPGGNGGGGGGMSWLTGLFASSGAGEGIGGAVGGIGGLSLSGAAGGVALIAAGTIAMGAIVSHLNDAANKSREVAIDIHRFDDLFNDQKINTIPQELSNALNGVMKDKRLVLQETVRALLGMESGSSSGLTMLKYFGANVNTNMLDLFNYTNTSGESKNKLVDMLMMSGDMNPAVSAMLLRYGGIDYNYLLENYGGAYAQAFSTGLQNWSTYGEQWSKNGGLSTAIQELQNYFLKSGTFDENNEWTIPSLQVEKLEPPADAALQIQEQVGLISLPAQLVLSAGGISSGYMADLMGEFFGHANGLPFVPYDGYLSVLHKGERVLTASENRNYTYNSNNYFGNVNLNNGQDVDALADAIDRRNRRQRSGYGA